jgi:hypothetical protein
MRPTRSSSIVAVAILAVAGASLFPPSASAAPPPRVKVRIHPVARVTDDGGITFRAWVRCRLPGTPDFRQGFAGASQRRGLAAGEGGLSPDVVCDGRWHVYTASVSSTTGTPFRRGLATASATVNACNVVGDTQVCANGSRRQVVVVLGRAAPLPPPPPEPEEPPVVVS